MAAVRHRPDPPIEKLICDQRNEMKQNSASINYPTWKKYMVLAKHVEKLRVRDKRAIFQMLRLNEHADDNTFFPAFGMTAGEFATFQVLKDNCSKNK